MPGLVADATRVWELNLYWPLHAQCGVWDPKGKGVDVWECIRPHHSTPGTQVCDLTPRFTPSRIPGSALTHSPLFLSAPKQPLLAIRCA
uniref:Type III effector protein n=1 Tax=Ganoderma boninense TaxID=34458 RepID=A0A5K1JZ82_9APHY|nr:Putative type III effector protein [Ganoderma boninense]